MGLPVDPGILWHASEADRWRGEDRAYAVYLDRVGRELVEEVHGGRDAYAGRRGMFHRAMRSSFAPGGLRPYGMFVPRSYDPSRPWPLLVLLHGAGSDYMATLRIAMGMTRMPGETKAMAARRIPPTAALPDLPALVVTPTGYGNTDFRFAAEREVLEVIDDVRAHYRVDDDRIWLAGISRGGWGAIQLGLRHAGRFAAIVDVCGFVDPFVGRPGSERGWDVSLREYEKLLFATRPIDSLERARGTEVVLVHGGRDPGTTIAGPERLARRLGELGLRHRALVYPGGFHHVWMPAFHRAYLFRLLEDVRRAPPDRVTLLAQGYRDGESRWVRIERIARHGRPARVEALVAGGRVTLETQNVAALSLALGQANVAPGEVRVVVDGADAWKGIAPERLDLVQGDGAWSVGPIETPATGTRKVRGLSGPIHDAFFERTVHVFGTLDPRAEGALRDAARRGAKLGYMGPATWIENPVVADREFRTEDFPDAAVALYGDAGDNAIVARIASRLPIAVGDGWVELRGRRYGAGHGVRMIAPFPEDPSRYVTVVAAALARDVPRAMGLPEALGDYVVFDATTIRGDYARVMRPNAGFVEAGFFDESWHLVPEASLVRSPGRAGMEALP